MLLGRLLMLVARLCCFFAFGLDCAFVFNSVVAFPV